MRSYPENLFFALRPADGAAEALASVRDWLAPPGATRIGTGHLHLTLLLLEPQLSTRTRIECTKQVLGEAMLPACRVMFDRLIGGRRSGLVLPSEPLLGVERLYAQLVSKVRCCGISAPKRWQFRPHVTLYYGKRSFSGPIDPIGWRAEELVLIRSHVGRTRHETIGRWSLQ